MIPGQGAVATVPGSLLLGSAPALQRDQLGTYLDAMHTHGDHVRFRIGPPGVGFTFDAVFSPGGARDVLGARDATFTKDAPVYDEFTHVFGDGLGSSTGDRWLVHRRILQPLFTRQHVEQSQAAIVTAGEELVAGLQDDGREVDLAEASMRFSLRALGRAIFGDHDLEETWPILHETLPVLSAHAARRGLAPVRLPRWVPTPANRRAERARQRLHGLVDELVHERSERTTDDDLGSERSDDAVGNDLLARLLEARDPETGAGLDDEDVRDEVLIFLAAGHETTGSALAMTLHLLGRHPRVQQRVRDEVSATLGLRAPTASDVRDLHVTRQVVLEALRLYPPLHTLVRKSVDGGEVLGQPVPPGRVVAVSVWGLHRNPRVWPDPGRFDPGRFDGDDHHDRHAHLPFGAGPRSCIGGHLAMTELVVAVAMVVRTYRVHCPDADPALAAGITLGPDGPLLATLERLGT